ncbi:hypothetical protein BP6252_10787 [Coleophoma cylindrospora]|uniref:Uncharacterized protein n=1 Tax=Coleophoma cylindrospora TaxID=1849047 RepID=A0A3D8QTH6_9HELO|nr:hypothetical protein BP6252_10787 [Coleophoma cylindrospora]
MSGNCPARADKVNTVWAFCPSTPAAILFTVLFALTTLAHLSQAIFYRKRYCWVIIGSGLIQTTNYIFRIISIIAPLFTNAFVYMVMGRMVWNYIPDAKLYRITAWRFTTYFVILDVIALIIQIAGAASGANEKQFNQEVLNGIHVYMGGVAFQQLSIFVFSFFAITFHLTILQQIREGVEGVSNAIPLLL